MRLRRGSEEDTVTEDDFIGFAEEKFYEFIRSAESRNITKFSINQPVLMNKVWVSKTSDKGTIPVTERAFGLSLLRYFTEKPNYHHVGGIRYAPCNLVIGIQKVVVAPTRVPRECNLRSVYMDMCAALPPSEGILALTKGANLLSDAPLFLVRTNFNTVSECVIATNQEILDEDVLKAAAELQDNPLEDAISKILALYSTTWDFVIR